MFARTVQRATAAIRNPHGRCYGPCGRVGKSNSTAVLGLEGLEAALANTSPWFTAAAGVSERRCGPAGSPATLSSLTERRARRVPAATHTPPGQSGDERTRGGRMASVGTQHAGAPNCSGIRLRCAMVKAAGGHGPRDRGRLNRQKATEVIILDANDVSATDRHVKKKKIWKFLRLWTRTKPTRLQTGGVNNSVLVAKRPIAPAAPTSPTAATTHAMGKYMMSNDHTELAMLQFRRSTDE